MESALENLIGESDDSQDSIISISSSSSSDSYYSHISLNSPKRKLTPPPLSAAPPLKKAKVECYHEIQKILDDENLTNDDKITKISEYIKAYETE